MPSKKYVRTLKIVLDTNNLVSSIINKKGPSWKIFDLARESKIKILTSNFQLSELNRVLSYPRIKKKYNLKPKDIKRTVSLLRKMTLVINPTVIPDIIKEDPDDNQILAIAKQGRVDLIISGDHHLLNLKKFGKMPILTAKLFMQNFNLARRK